MKAKNWNPPVVAGDTIVLYHMEGESAVVPGTKGVVTSVSKDPFEDDGKIINVKWENGSTLSLLTTTDAWKKVEKTIEEQSDPTMDFMSKNVDLLENFDWRFLRQFLYKLRESGFINMFAATPLLYSGKEHIERYYGEGREDDETFQEVLEMADEAKDKVIQGVIKYMEKNNKDLDNINQVNRFAQHFANKMLSLFITLSSYRS